MKGIYLTEEDKKEIEKELVFLEDERKQSSSGDNNDYYQGRMRQLRIILESAIILPLEESWDKTNAYYNLKAKYPNGVIIKPTINN